MDTLLVSWGPMLLLIAVWLFVYRRGFSQNARTTIQAQTAELSKIHQSLERIASALETDIQTRPR
jgi:hypothetical protein